MRAGKPQDLKIISLISSRKSSADSRQLVLRAKPEGSSVDSSKLLPAALPHPIEPIVFQRFESRPPAPQTIARGGCKSIN
jgi:hypothetical protein